MAYTMLSLIVLLLAFVPLGFTASVPGLTTVRSEQKPLSDMMFEGTIHGVAVQLNGTAESIYSKFKQLHPDVVAEYERNNPPVGSSVVEQNTTLTSQSDLASRSTLEGRQAWANVYPPYCCPVAGWNWGEALQWATIQGVSYLNSLNGNCNFGPLARSRVSCSYSAAIFFDWDGDDSWISVGCSRIGGMAQDLVNSCSWLDKSPGQQQFWWTCGQEFNTGPLTADFNVVVRYDSC